MRINLTKPGLSLIFLITCSLLSVIAKTQNKVLSNIPVSGALIQSVIPPGYDTIEVVKGDLNKDNRTDIVVSLRYENEDEFEMDHEPKRLLLVLLNKKGGFSLAGKSLEVLMCRHCGGAFGDPYAGVSIEEGVLHINHYGGSSWRWIETEKFRYQHGGFYLVGSTSDYFWNASDCNGEGVGEAGRKYKEINWITGQREIIENDEDCRPLKHIKDKIKVKPLIKLEAYKRNKNTN